MKPLFLDVVIIGFNQDGNGIYLLKSCININYLYRIFVKNNFSEIHGNLFIKNDIAPSNVTLIEMPDNRVHIINEPYYAFKKRVDLLIDLLKEDN